MAKANSKASTRVWFRFAWLAVVVLSLTVDPLRGAAGETQQTFATLQAAIQATIEASEPVKVLAHRIGENELNAIELGKGFVEAQLEYATTLHDGSGLLEYAQRFMSTPGRQDGLYWDRVPDSFVPKSFAAAASDESGSAKPYHGYYFRILKAQGPDAPGGALNYVVNNRMIGGFAMIAWPAEYGASGIKTFIVNHNGVIYEQDLGTDTPAIVQEITSFNPDPSWHRVE